MRVLAGDIGGTKTLLAIADVDGDSVRIHTEHRYDSHAYPSLEPIVRDFVARAGADCERAAFGIAGPVIDHRCQATNVPWIVDAAALRDALNLGPTRLVNDFVAVAHAVPALRDEDLVVLNRAARVPHAPIAVLGAGTGLGEALLVWNGTHYDVVASEGGHADFAPSDDQQIGLLRHLRARHGHVSWERVVSGIGLRNIYAYLRETAAVESPTLRDAFARGDDMGPLVGELGVAGTDAISVATLDLFVRAYGAEAGNLALKSVARGGVFVAGGIAPKILPALTDGTFRNAYVDKGRFRALVECIACHVVTNPRVGLIGAAIVAAL